MKDYTHRLLCFFFAFYNVGFQFDWLIDGLIIPSFRCIGFRIRAKNSTVIYWARFFFPPRFHPCLNTLSASWHWPRYSVHNSTRKFYVFVKRKTWLITPTTKWSCRRTLVFFPLGLVVRICFSNGGNVVGCRETWKVFFGFFFFFFVFLFFLIQNPFFD